jgi:hypothetical protein
MDEGTRRSRPAHFSKVKNLLSRASISARRGRRPTAWEMALTIAGARPLALRHRLRKDTGSLRAWPWAIREQM